MSITTKKQQSKRVFTNGTVPLFNTGPADRVIGPFHHLGQTFWINPKGARYERVVEPRVPIGKMRNAYGIEVDVFGPRASLRVIPGSETNEVNYVEVPPGFVKIAQDTGLFLPYADILVIGEAVIDRLEDEIAAKQKRLKDLEARERAINERLAAIEMESAEKPAGDKRRVGKGTDTV